jgi:hypothetical protein
VFDSIFFRHVEHEFVLYLSRRCAPLSPRCQFYHEATYFEHCLVRLEPDILDTSIDHQRDQIEYQVGVLAEADECGIAKAFEPIVMWRVGASHSIDHLTANFHRGRERFRVSTENVAEVN